MESPARSRPFTGPLKAVVLDWAGTAVDFGCMGPVGTFVEVFRREGVRITTAEAREPMGLRKIDHLRALCAMESIMDRWKTARSEPIGEEDIGRMYARLEPLMIQAIREHSDPIPGLLEFVSRCRARDIAVGSTTGYTRPIMEVLVGEAARKGYRPDCVVTSSEVPRARPAPFMCYQCAIELQVYPLEAMVKIGDTVSDIMEGLNAGMWTVAVTRSGSDLGLTEAEAEALPAGELQERLDAIAASFRAVGAHYTAPDMGQCWPILEDIGARLSTGERP
ncbi:MAG: phosphonoacetaldehyde hydrolase [Syntrophobacteraceae bacterium]|nr:phosphonoacetaldehyde hydrolase [Syntrophobacteraceae bacterium]